LDVLVDVDLVGKYDRPDPCDGRVISDPDTTRAIDVVPGRDGAVSSDDQITSVAGYEFWGGSDPVPLPDDGVRTDVNGLNLADNVEMPDSSTMTQVQLASIN
jgi:hypothetical protein